MTLVFCKRRVKFDNFNTCEGFESAQIIVTVNALPWNVELTEPVHIVTSVLVPLDLSSDRV